MPQRYLLNIGNTHTQCALDTEEGPMWLATMDTAALLHKPLPLPSGTPWTAFAVSVVPPVTAALSARYGRQIRFLKAADFPQIDFSQVDVSTIGMDRIANAAEAHAIHPGGAIVMDCGTAITLECIDGDGHFLGGSILPGRRLLRICLHEHTAQLPLLPLQDALPAAMGTTTATAMFSGMDLGLIGALQRIVGDIRTAIGRPDCPVFTVGGDAPYFLRHLPNLLPPGAPLFTLRGILQSPTTAAEM